MSQCAAVIGLGNIASRHRRNIKLIFPGIKILAMSSSGRIPITDVDNADELIADIQGLVAARPDFVIVASPAPFHAQHALVFLENGIPVLIEKPVTASVSDAELLIDTAEKYQTPVSVGYCLRYLSSAQEMKKLLCEGVIGTVYNIHASVGHYLPDWRLDKSYLESVSANADLGGGALLELSHEFDYLQWLFGDMTSQYSLLRSSNELNLDVEEIADVVLTCENGAVCTVHLDFLQKRPQRKCTIIGSEGRLVWDLIKNTICLYNRAGESTIYSTPGWDKNQMYLSLLESFLSLVKINTGEGVSLLEARKTIVLIESIKNQASWGVKL